MHNPIKKVLLVLASLWAGYGVLVTPPASTAVGASATVSPAHPDIAGSPVTTTNGCGNSAITDVRVVTPGTPRVGQTFHLILTVAAISRGGAQCVLNQDQQFGINFRLPDGVEDDPHPELSGCIVFRAANPANSTVRSCRRSDGGDGFWRVDPQGEAQWTLNPNGVNVVQIQLGVRSRTTGQKHFEARICDARSEVACVGDPPVTNAIPFVDFNVAAAPTLSPADLGIVVAPPGGTEPPITRNSIKVTASINIPHPSGTWVLQMRVANVPMNWKTASTKEAGSSDRFHFKTVGSLSSGRFYQFRSCFTPTFGTRVCGAQIQARTLDQ